MSTSIQESTITSTTLPAPAWATSEGDFKSDCVRWSREVELDAMEVDGAASMTVEAYLYDSFDYIAGRGCTINRGTPEIEVTRHCAEDPGWVGSSLRFEIANARKFAATILAACDAVEGTAAAKAMQAETLAEADEELDDGRKQQLADYAELLIADQAAKEWTLRVGDQVATEEQRAAMAAGSA